MRPGVGGAHRSRERWLTASAPLTLTAAAAVLLGGPPLGLAVPAAVLVAAAASGLLHAVWLFKVAGQGTSAASLTALGTGLGAAAACAAWPPTAPFAGPAAALLLVAGLLALPGVTASPAAALRRGLDGICVALWKFLTLLVLVLDQSGPPSRTVFVTCLLATTGITVAVVSGVRAPFPRGAALTAAGGVALVVLALAIVPLLPAEPARHDAWLLSAGGLLVLGSVLVWAGACRSVYGHTSSPRVIDGTLIGDPLLVAPVLAGAAAVLYTLVSHGRIGQPAMVVGAAAVLVVVLREIVEALATRRFSGELGAAREAFATIVAGSSDVILVLGKDLAVRWQSPAAARQFGLSDQEVLGRPFVRLVHAADVATVRRSLSGRSSPAPVRTRICDGFGVWRHVEYTVSDLRDDPSVEGVVVHLRDAAERLELERTLERAARADPLTGLANRGTLLRELDGGTGFLVTVGLDGFAGVNDLHGNDVGDALLVAVAARIRAAIAPDDLAARLHGDEFAVFTRVDKVHAYTLATRLLGELGEPYPMPGTVLQLSAGIGLAPVAGEPEDSLRRADLALRRAKRTGRGQVEWHDEAAEEAYVRRATLEQHLPQAVERGELDLAFHPVYDLVEGHPIGVEALLRWRHPRLGTIPPRETLTVARELGLTAPINDWVLARAARQLSLWQHEGYRLWISVNVAFDDFVAPTFPARLSLALDSHQVDPRDFIIELAERELGTDLERVAEPLATVRAIGVRTALDGFGSGATSLAHLRRLPTDLLKVDRTLFTASPGGGVAPIIDVVVNLGRRLGVTVIAHGLEAGEHLELVRRAGCRYGQGHYYGQPAPAERIEAALVRQRTW
ncbi:putative bifunctional diguanylate cyclase/phosphodiesterase [Dactylosporangium sp. CS-047395]|uniref:putative bifunctional diguanylate cyclase/phosphodiesterase n=1 Tax=Dactylosporangium sp. CS-047395 TaxID=3239936 RepID=UPI003D8C965F